MHPYDQASQIVQDAFPAIKKADEIMGGSFPSLAAADRVLAGAGLIPKGRRGLTAGTAGGLRAGEPQLGTGGRRRSPAAMLIAKSAKVGGGADIRVWAAKLQSGGVDRETIYGAYAGVGGDAALSAQQRAGDTSEFFADFVEALEGVGVDRAVILGAYQQAGGRFATGG